MGDNNTKWEPVSWDELVGGESIRLTHEAYDDIVHGDVSESGEAIITALYTLDKSWLKEHSGYKAERAVPERTLPSEDGIYASAEDYALGDYHLYARNGGEWQDDTREAWLPSDEALIPFDLVRLVPVTEVEELRERIKNARDWAEGYWSGKSVPESLLVYLDGEARS